MSRDTEYELNNIGYDWQYPIEMGGGIKCKNYELCDAVLPKDWFEYKCNYLCTNCHMEFGTWGNLNGKGHLKMFDDIECPICLDTKRNIELPNCEHTICIDCFKRCRYGTSIDSLEPSFPYPEIEDEYYDDTENEKWSNDYPLISEYNKASASWSSKRYIAYDDEKYNRKCPMCRK